MSHLRQYIIFTTHYQVQDFPVHLAVLLRFIAFLGRSSLGYKYAFNIVGSVKYFASLLDPPSVKIFDAVVVVDSLKGLKAQLSRPVRQKLPFTVNHLGSFYVILNLHDTKILSCWCAMLLAFFGCFRLSNLVPPSRGKFDPLKHLKRDDIRFEGGLTLVYYKWSKTNQNANRVSWVPIGTVSDPRFNVMTHLQTLFSAVKAPSNAPLFTFKKNDHNSRYSLVKLLESCVIEARLSPADYSWHSFRRGAAVFAFELGLADSAVQLLGDWSSSAFKNYLDFAFNKKASIAKQIARSFDSQVKSSVI